MRLVFGVLLSAVALGATSASAQDSSLLPADARNGFADPTRPQDPLLGQWRFEGVDRYQAKYAGTMQILRSNKGYEYRRSLDVSAGVPRAYPSLSVSKDIGLVRVDGTFVYTKQTYEDGLLKTFGFDRTFRRHTRHAFYRLNRQRDKMGGFTIIPTSFHTGREQLTKRTRDRNNEVTLLVDGGEFFPALREALEGAQRSIVLQSFIYTDDSTGRWIGRLLSKKAREGVKVRVLLDNINTKIGKQLKAEWKDAGVELIIQHTWGKGLGNSVKNTFSNIWSGIKRLFGGKKPAPKEERGLFNHDHRKITVVDGRIGFIGGMNIAREYESVWHDVHSRVEGSAVATLEDLFYDRWKAAGGKVKSRPEPDPVVLQGNYFPGDMKVEVAVTLPGLKTEIKDRYLREIRYARRSVHIEVAYFLDDSIINGLKRAAVRGVDTVVIIPNDDDHDVPIVRDAFEWAQNDIIKSGVRLYKYRGRMVHSKVASFDREVATVGSANLDNMALTKLSEANIFVPDRRFAEELETRIIEADIPQSTRVQVKKQSFWKKIKSGTLRLFRNLL